MIIEVGREIFVIHPAVPAVPASSPHACCSHRRASRGQEKVQASPSTTKLHIRPRTAPYRQFPARLNPAASASAALANSTRLRVPTFP